MKTHPNKSEGNVKKQLLTTTALVAAGMITATGSANAISLSLGGFQEGIVGAVDNKSGRSGVREGASFDVQHDGEIHFKASTTLDNGLKIRTRVELESATSSADQIDEAYISVSGNWGEVRIGSEDNAAHLMVTPTMGSWATNVGQNLNFDVTDWVILPTGHNRNGTTPKRSPTSHRASAASRLVSAICRVAKKTRVAPSRR